MGYSNRRFSLLWRIALCIGIGGIGGIIVDFDHILNAATGLVGWDEFHTLAVFLFLCGLFIASIGGLLVALFLARRITNARSKNTPYSFRR